MTDTTLTHAKIVELAQDADRRAERAMEAAQFFAEEATDAARDIKAFAESPATGKTIADADKAIDAAGMAIRAAIGWAWAAQDYAQDAEGDPRAQYAAYAAGHSLNVAQNAVRAAKKALKEAKEKVGAATTAAPEQTKTNPAGENGRA